MTEGNTTAAAELDGVLRRLDSARDGLIVELRGCNTATFETEVGEESVRRLAERTADDLNFYYGRLAARALNLPQPPCMQKAEFMSLREATVSLQVAHRRFSNLLHDLLPADLEKLASDPELGSYTLRQVIEMAAAQYSVRTQQVRAISAGGS